MKEPKDKRTKAWKEWKQNFDKQNSVGLGDVVEKVTKATGIKKMVETFTDGKDCGCSKRKEMLNKIQVNLPMVRCFTKEQFYQWKEFRKVKGDITHKHMNEIIIPIFNQLFARKIQKASCCPKRFIDPINDVYESYL